MEISPPSRSPDSAVEASRPGPTWKSAAVALSAGTVTYLAFRLLALAPGWVDATYGRVAGPAISWLLSWVTAPFPFPVAQGAVAAYGLWLLVLAAGALREVVEAGGSRLRALTRAAGRGVARVGRDAGVLLASFYLLWGFHYARPPLEDRLGLARGEGADRAELIRLAERAVSATNDAYRVVHGRPDAGSPTRVTVDRTALREALAEGWRRASARTGLAEPYRWSFGPAKEFVPDGFLVRAGLGGFYSPWTGEAVVDGGTPAADLVQSVAHEQAHQRGTAPEDEASFLGFLAASRTPLPVARYSALLFAQRHLVAAASSGGRPDLRERLTSERLPGVRRDLEDLYAYLRRRIRAAARVTRRVNDAYLKSNRVEGGVASYGLVTRLLVAQSRSDEHGLFPPSHRSQPAQSGGSSPK